MRIEKVSIKTLGCRVNQYESEAIAQRFVEEGYELTRNHGEADILIVNTCCVTKTAESKSRRAIHHLHSENPCAMIVVVGCYSQRAGHELLDTEGVGLICGNSEKQNLVSLVENVKKKQKPQLEVSDIMRRHEFPGAELTVKDNRRVRAYVKIQDGCEQFCTYCIVPYVRGPVVSRPYEDIMAEGRSLDQAGYHELVLTGIHTGFYGRDLKDGNNLVSVLEGLLRETSIERIRLSSIEPTEVSNELLTLMTREPRLCPHLHVPMQSGNDAILKAMNRRYTRSDYLSLTKRIYEALPDAAVSADVMVGFPGESEGAFEQTLETVREAGLSFLHCFPYSPRPGTKAAILPHRVPMALKEKRQKRLLSLGRELKENYARRYIGWEVQVLAESRDKDGCLRGRSENFIEIHFAGKPHQIGHILTVRCERAKDGVLYGSQVGKEE